MCGICGVLGGERSAFLTFLLMYGQQHRGHEGAGITVVNDRWHTQKDLGLVVDAFGLGSVFESELVGKIAIGQNRYSTSGSSRRKSEEEREKTKKNLQPFSEEGLSIIFNGNLVDHFRLRSELESVGARFETDVDTEAIFWYMSMHRETPLAERVYDFSKKVNGAYSLAVMEKSEKGEHIVLARDPLGIRPLVLGEVGGEYLVFASETCAFQVINANYLRSVEPGEIVMLDSNGFENKGFLDRTKKRAACIFEDIYFKMPESLSSDYTAGRFKEDSGRQLALEHPTDAELVIGVPDSANRSTWGFAQQSGTPERPGLNRNKYSGRTFIQPGQYTRDLGVRMKFFVDPGIVSGRRLAVVDDSIVRATTTPHVIKLLRKHGAKEIHMRIASPPLRHPCFMGVDLPDPHEFGAHDRSVEEIRNLIGADSLSYLGLEGLLKCATGKPEDYCTACFSGDYPIDVSEAVAAQQARISLR